MLKNIRVKDHDDFPCAVGWNVEEARNEIRKTYILTGGCIVKNRIAARPTDLITSDGEYEFINFQTVTQSTGINTGRTWQEWLFILFGWNYQQAGRQRVNAPPTLVTEQVFALGLGRDCVPNMILEYNDLLGTCFAVTKRHLLTARHVLCESDNVTPLFDVTSGMALNQGTFVISRGGSKSGSSVVFPSPMAVRVVHSSLVHDWALLELVDPALEFPVCFHVCPKSELPNLRIETVDLKAFIAPIGQFIKSAVTDLEIWSDDYHRVLQYDKNRTQIIVEGGLYRGSCGSPYVNHEGKVVALHLESDHEGENVSLVKPARNRYNKATALSLTTTVDKVIDHVTDLASVYASSRIGVVLANVPDLIELIEAKIRNI